MFHVKHWPALTFGYIRPQQQAAAGATAAGGAVGGGSGPQRGRRQQ